MCYNRGVYRGDVTVLHRGVDEVYTQCVTIEVQRR